MKIQSTKDIKHQHVCILLYGRAGVGKTRWCATANNPLFLDCEKGLLSLQDCDVNYINIKSINDLRVMMPELRKHLAESNHTLIVDSLTELSDLSMEDIKRELGNGQAKDARKTYPMLYDKTIAVIRALQGLPCDVIFTAKNDCTDKGLNHPRVQGSRLRSELCHYFDTIIYLEGDEQNGIIGTTGVREHCEGKDRSGKLEQTIDVINTPLALVIGQMKGIVDDTD